MSAALGISGEPGADMLNIRDRRELFTAAQKLTVCAACFQGLAPRPLSIRNQFPSAIVRFSTKSHNFGILTVLMRKHLAFATDF